MHDIRTFIVKPGTPELAACARWRADAFSVLDADFERELASLEAFAADPALGVALIARRNGVAAGTCLLVESEIEPNHDVSPWLAGLFVAPEHRKAGVGRVLVRAIEDEARLRGFARLFLYTTAAAGFYEQLGWELVERTTWRGFDTAFMARGL